MKRLRLMVRLYVLLEGLASVSLVLGIAFWSGLAIDWLFEPVPVVRVVMWLAVGLAACWVLVRSLLSRVFARLPDASLALLVERNFPELGESLVTSVEAASQSSAQPLGNAVLLRQTSQVADQLLGDVSLRQLFRWKPLAWKAVGAIGLIVSITVFAVGQREAFAFWIDRMQLTEQLWPRAVQLSVVGFEQETTGLAVHVARDDDYQLLVEASIEEEHIAPEQVEIRYRLADGRRGRDTMVKVGEALPGRDTSQQFRYTFRSVGSDLQFDVVGGDDRIRGLWLRVVERPQIERILLECEYPSYLDRSPRTIPVSGRVELPEGTRAICRLQTNKPLAALRVHDVALQQDIPSEIEASNPQEARFMLEMGKEDRVLQLTVRDTQQVENREPYRVVVSAVGDMPPDVSVQLRGIGTAVTPQARIPLQGLIQDEYGVEGVWFEFQTDKIPSERRKLDVEPNGARKFTALGDFDLSRTDPQTNRRLLALKPGEKLTLAVEATDAYDLQTEPHVGRSQRFLLDVVTESELRALLEKRELALRQRFEAIYEKMVGTRELLARIESEPTQDELEATEQQRRHKRDRLRADGSRQNVTQLAYETLGVAEGFDDIVAELANNRVDTEELKQRLGQGISEPLKNISGELMPDLEAMLQDMTTAFDEDLEIANSLQLAKVQGDVVVEAMKKVLDRMLELESYNELVEILRGIVAEQKKLREQTHQQRREKLRRILGDE